MINRSNKTILELQFASIKRWFDAIASAVGNEKLVVVRDFKNNDRLTYSFLKFYLDPLNAFHIGMKSIESDIEPSGDPYGSASSMLHELSSVPAITNKIIAKVKQTLLTIKDEDVRAFAVQYITKTAKIGITAKSVNKAVGSKDIRTFECMLANKYFNHPSSIIGKTISVTEKLDGIRALAVVKMIESSNEDGFFYKVDIISRQGQPITGLNEIESAIKQLAINCEIADFVLDGELLVTDRDSIPSKEQYKRTTKIVRTNDENKVGITYNVFDIIDLDSFEEVTQSDTYSDRRRCLNNMFSNHTGSKSIRLVPIEATFKADDAEKTNEIIIELVNKAREADKEGIMLNVCDAKYQCKRTNDLLKVKVFQDCDLKIIGFQEGTGKFAGTLGALIVDYKGNQLGVGSGMTDDQRKEFWNNQNKYMNRVVTVQYFEETYNLTGTYSLRFPVFKELREEGKEVSYN